MHWALDHSEKRGLKAHRGSFKSTCITEIGPVYVLSKNPEETIAIVRKSYSLGAEMLRNIMGIMESPAIYYFLLHCWFADANNEIPDNAEWHFDVRKEGKLNLSIRKQHTKECTLECGGINSSWTGSHYSRGIFDDVTALQDRQFNQEREVTNLVVNELLSNVLNRGCPAAIVGTSWHREDCLERLEASGVPFRKYPVALTGLMNDDEIAEAKRTQTGPLYDCNYNLVFTSTEDMIFVDPHMGVWEHNQVKDVVAHVDAAYGGDDRNALTIMGRLPNNKINAVGFRFDGHIKDRIPEIYSLLSKYKARHLYMETNGDKGLVLDMFMQHPLAKTYGIWPEAYSESQKKQIKIATHLYDRWYHIQWAEETTPEYLIEICDWTEYTKEHDDCPDSAASLLREAGLSTCQDYSALYS